MRSRSVRAWRGTAAAGVATFAAAVSHSVADHHPAPGLGVLLALVFAVPVCVALAGRRMSWWRLGIAVAVSQFAFHGLMLIGLGESSGATYASMPGMAGHAEQLMPAAASATTMAMAPMAPHDAWMWLAHAFAALITVLAIGHGERAIRALLDLSGWNLVFRILDWRPAPARRRTPIAVGWPFAVHSALASSVVRRRGPPVAA